VSSATVAHLLRDPTLPFERLLALGRQALGELAAAAPVLVGVTIAVAATIVALGRWQAARRGAGARWIRIGVPPSANPDAAGLLWTGLHELLRPRFVRLLAGQPQIAWEIQASDTGTSFAIWAPATVPAGLIERAVSATWPGSTLTVEQPPPAMPSARAWAFAELALADPEWLSLSAGGGADPLALVLGQLAGLRAGEHALVQLVARPASGRQRARLRTIARQLRAGAPVTRTGRLLHLLHPGPQRAPTHDPTIGPDVRAVMQKASEPLFRFLIRTAVGASSRSTARDRIHAINGAFAAYQARNRLRRHHLHRPETKLQLRTLGRRARLASVAELAALAHLPADQSIPGIVRAGARSVPPPPGAASAGKPLGVDRDARPVLLDVADARHHLHLLGPTGVGKSTLIAQLALADLAAGRGSVVIDPAGDLIDDLLARIPDGHEDRVDLFDPLDPAPPGLNVLDGDDHDLVVDQLVGIFARVFERFWGPRTDDVLRACLLTLTAAPEPATLVDVPRLLTDPQWRAQLLLDLDDPVGLEPFWGWYDALTQGAQMHAIAPLLNKLRAFLLRRPVRAIIGQQRTTLDIPRCLDEGRLLLVRLPKGTLGEDTSRLLGSFIVARVWQAALARASQPPAQRRDCALAIDEVQNFLTLPTPLPDILAEARKYRLSLLLAHQHLGQLRKDMRSGLTNARTKIYFQLSPTDAAALRNEVEPELDAYDLEHLPAHHAATRVCRAGQAGAAFTLTTEPLAPGSPERARAVRVASRRRIGTRREQVEALERQAAAR
jgi:uncharacterized protein DUF87/type IV secretory system conjugative DNA transfer VirD4/TraG family protein